MKNLKRFLVTTLIAVMMIVPTSILAQSYDLTFEFTVDLKGVTRSYDKGNINVTVKSTETVYMYTPGSTTFTVRLYRYGTFSDTLIGSFNASRDGSTSDGWTNLESGKYYFRLLKTNDQTTLTGTMKVTQ